MVKEDISKAKGRGRPGTQHALSNSFVLCTSPKNNLVAVSIS